MAWQDHLKGDSLAWLLESETPVVRYLALKDVLDYPETDPALREARKAAHQSGPIAQILSQMDEAGFWVKPGAGYNPKYRSTVWSVVLLAQLGAHVKEDRRIHSACQYLLAHSLTAGGQFTASGTPSGTADCLQGNLCWALLKLGCEDERLQKAFEWMARSVTGEGVSPAEERQAAVRYYAGKCGPTFSCGANNRLPCAWGAAKVMLAFSQLPPDRQTPLTRRAVQHGIGFLLSSDPASAAYPCGYSPQPSRSWWKFGFPVFYVTDILQIVEALAAVGCGSDPRLSNAVALILSKQDAAGRWPLEYDYSDKTWADFGEKRQLSKWVTLRALRTLKLLDMPSTPEKPL